MAGGFEPPYKKSKKNQRDGARATWRVRVLAPPLPSASFEQEIAYCKKNGIPYQKVRDGEVIIIG
jgi:hypothetical protein